MTLANGPLERHVRAYRFFDRIVVVESDNQAVADVLDAVYDRQRLPHLPPTAVPVVVSVTTGATGATIAVGDRTVRVPDATQVAHYAHLVLVNAAAAMTENLLVLHAGAVAHHDQAAVLVGASGWGKTTLTMELVRRGWRLLTDDFAPVTREGVVEPFVRRVNVTERSMALLGLSDPGSAPRLVGFDRAPKWMLNIDQVFPNRVAEPARLAAVFLLGPPPAPGVPSAPDRWLLRVDHVPPGFQTALAELPDVVAVQRLELDGPPTLAVDAVPGSRLVAPLDAICAGHDVSVLWAGRGNSRRPDFGGAPELAALPAAEALPVLLSHALSLSGRRFLAGSRPSDAFQALAHLQQALAASGAVLYRLTPGRLDATADVVEERTLASA